MKLQLVHPSGAVTPQGQELLQACEKYPFSDRPLFRAGYGELCRVNLEGKSALEICGGHGELAYCLARAFPKAKVTGLDLYTPQEPVMRGWLQQCPNLSYTAGTAFDLSSFEPNSLDLIWGQAALHHLAHSATDLGQEAVRVLKPGGRLVFIFEPLGHNLLVAAIRAMRMSLAEMVDESNLFLSQIERMASPFSSCEVQIFNLVGYAAKALSDRWAFLGRAIQNLDSFLFHSFSSTLRYGANCNIIFTK